MNRSQTYRDKMVLRDVIPASMTPETMNANFEEIGRFLASLGGAERSIETLARLLGGILFEGLLVPTGDTMFEHELGEIPSMVLLSVAADGLGREVYGHPAGSDGLGGLNKNPWTPDRIYLRAPRAGTYTGIVI